MNAVSWILDAVLALAFLAAGGLKLAQPRSALTERGMGWAADFSDGAVKGIGALEVVGAVGLVLPKLLGIAPVLSPLAALGLAAVMVGAVVVHVRRRESPAAPAVLGVLSIVAAVIGFGRV